MIGLEKQSLKKTCPVGLEAPPYCSINSKMSPRWRVVVVVGQVSQDIQGFSPLCDRGPGLFYLLKLTGKLRT